MRTQSWLLCIVVLSVSTCFNSTAKAGMFDDIIADREDPTEDMFADLVEDIPKKPQLVRSGFQEKPLDSGLVWSCLLVGLAGLASAYLISLAVKDRKLFGEIAKWILILIVAAVLFSIVYPRYYFGTDSGLIGSRGNKITGRVEGLTGNGLVSF